MYPRSISADKLYTMQLPGNPSTLSGKFGSITNLNRHSCFPGAIRCVEPVCRPEGKMTCSSLTNVPLSRMTFVETFGEDDVGELRDQVTFHLPSNLILILRTDMWSGLLSVMVPVRVTGSASL
jgi:hypothetical protein